MNSRLIAILLGVEFLAAAALAASPGTTLDVYWMDVEGGSSTLIVTPEKQSILIDAGNPGDRDAGRIHHVAADVAGVTKIDMLFVTHFHSDHVGGAADLAKLMPIGTVFDRGIPEHDPDGKADDTQFKRLIAPYRDMKVDRRVVIQPGFVQRATWAVGSENLRCLAVGQRFIENTVAASTNEACADATTRTADTTDNINSVVLLLSFGPFRMYLGGDLSWNLESKLVCPSDLVGKVDVYQADHHGFNDASNPVLIHTIDPTVAVISNGPQKGGQADIFKTLRGTPGFQDIYEIHRNLQRGNPTNAPDEFIANLTVTNDGNYIKLSVAPDGKSYTMSIPANGHSRTYKTHGQP